MEELHLSSLEVGVGVVGPDQHYQLTKMLQFLSIVFLVFQKRRDVHMSKLYEVTMEKVSLNHLLLLLMVNV